MNSHLSWKEWRDRLYRIAGRAERSFGEVERLLSWHVLGGKRFFSNYKDELRNAHKWCFIVGCNNSGTSLLQRIIEDTSEVSTFPNEGQRYTQSLIKAERRGYERVWSEYLDDLRMTSDSGFDRVPRLLHDWMRELSQPIQGTVVEKTTANAVRMPWLQEVFPHSYFIGLVRNGYAVAEGIRRKGKKQVGRGAAHWNTVNKMMLADSKDVEHFILISYEDLVDNTMDVVAHLQTFMGIKPRGSGGLVHLAEQEVASERIVNRNPVSIAKLSRDDLEVIGLNAHEMLDYFGYQPTIQLQENTSRAILTEEVKR